MGREDRRADLVGELGLLAERLVVAVARLWHARRDRQVRQLKVDYTVVMPHPVSIRFRDVRVAEQLKVEAAARNASTSSLAEELIDEGLRIRRHPLVCFRDGPAGRRAHLMGGPDVWEVIDGLVGGDVPPDQRISRAVETFGLPRHLVEAALAYYAEFTDEINAQIRANRDAAEQAEIQWRRQHDLLAR